MVPDTAIDDTTDDCPLETVPLTVMTYGASPALQRSAMSKN